MGKSIFDLIDKICERTKSPDLILRLNEIVAQTLGKEFEKSFEKCFDYQLATDELAFFEGRAIPKIDLKYIPKEISGVQFDCDLSQLAPIRKLKNKSVLHGSLLGPKH